MLQLSGLLVCADIKNNITLIFKRNFNNGENGKVIIINKKMILAN